MARVISPTSYLLAGGQPIIYFLMTAYSTYLQLTSIFNAISSIYNLRFIISNNVVSLHYITQWYFYYEVLQIPCSTSNFTVTPPFKFKPMRWLLGQSLSNHFVLNLNCIVSEHGIELICNTIRKCFYIF